MREQPTDHSRIIDNIFRHSKREEFNGTHQATQIDDAGVPAITLKASSDRYPASGTYTSQVIESPPFRQLVMSWNADTPANTYVEIEARVLRTDLLWSGWHCWGTWGRTVVCSSANSSDDVAKLDTDTLTVQPDGVEAVALQYRVNLYSDDPAETPNVRLIAGTIANDIPGRRLTRAYNPVDVPPAASIELPVPQYSQYKRDPQFAHGICSPTCLTMAMEFYGKPILVEEVVRAAWDDAYAGYGNWSFNAAVAGSYGFAAYVAYFWGQDDAATLDRVRQALAAGKPLITSVRYRNSETVERKLPVLDGAPIAKTAGHLVLVRGITERDGEAYLIVNDPAAPGDDTVRREYRADQFLAAWTRRVAYVIEPVGSDSVTACVPEHQPAYFKPTGRVRDNDGLEEVEYALQDENDEAISLSNKGSKHHICILCRKPDEPLQYIAPLSEDTIWFTREFVAQGYELTVLYNAGKVYQARLASL